MNLDDAALFARILELGTLSAVARERNVPVSRVTRSLARLEAQFGARLLHRTPHGLSPTDEGRTFVSHVQRMLEIEAELRDDISGKVADPSGWVRVGVSAIAAQSTIVPSLPSLYARHPKIHVELAVDDRIVDMAREGIDIAIRTGNMVSDTLVARLIGQHTRRLYASRAYADRHGLPAHPDDLARHALIGNSGVAALNRWRLTKGREVHEIVVRGRSRADNTAVAMSLVAHGLGIGRFVDFVAEPMVTSGQLVPVMGDWAADSSVPVYAVMLKERHRLPKLRACIDHWVQWFALPQPKGSYA